MDETLKTQIEEYLRSSDTIRSILFQTRDILLTHHGFTTYRVTEADSDLVIVTLDGVEYTYSADGTEVYYANGSPVPETYPVVKFFREYLPLVEWGFDRLDAVAAESGWTKVWEDEESVTYQVGQTRITIPVWSTTIRQVTVTEVDVEVRDD